MEQGAQGEEGKDGRAWRRLLTSAKLSLLSAERVHEMGE
jgi:hypothetical protein